MSKAKLSFLCAVALTASGAFAASNAGAANDRVQFPETYKVGVHYATVNRGGIREELFTSRDVIEAARAGRPVPSGSVITMEDYRDGRLHRYVVMEKRVGWGEAYPENVRAGDWEFREFAPDLAPNMSESGQRCMSCHQRQAGEDFLFTIDRMRSAN